MMYGSGVIGVSVDVDSVVVGGDRDDRGNVGNDHHNRGNVGSDHDDRSNVVRSTPEPLIVHYSFFYDAQLSGASFHVKYILVTMNSLEAIHVAVSTIGSGNIFFSEQKLSFVKTLVKVYLQRSAVTWNNRPCLLYHLHLRKLFLNVHGLNYRRLNKKRF